MLALQGYKIERYAEHDCYTMCDDKGRPHSVNDAPSVINTTKDGLIMQESWHVRGLLGRNGDRPSTVTYIVSDDKKSVPYAESWYDGTGYWSPCRNTGPAIILYNIYDRKPMTKYYATATKDYGSVRCDEGHVLTQQEQTVVSQYMFDTTIQKFFNDPESPENLFQWLPHDRMMAIVDLMKRT